MQIHNPYFNHNPAHYMQNFPGLQTPLTIAMWDFSWLQCAHPGGKFEDLARHVAGAAERGYNCLRVDVFPHYYVETAHHFPPHGLSRRIRTWGDVLAPQGWKVDVRSCVRNLAHLCRQHNIFLALDTWTSFAVLGRDRIPRVREERVCRAWAEAWVRALRLMREDGVLERAAWIAPLNEVPLFLGALMESVRVSDSKQRHEGLTDFQEDLPELDAVFLEINRWLGEAVADEITKDKIPLAYSALGAENYARRVPDFYDLVDIHFMPDLVLEEEDRTELERAGSGASGFSLHAALNNYDLSLYSRAWAAACSRHYGRMLALAHAYCKGALARTTLPSGKRLSAVVTEAYGPCNFPDHPEVDWSWYKHWNADAARIFAAYRFNGLTLSNHAEPIFSLWDDIDWHRRGTQAVLAMRKE